MGLRAPEDVAQSAERLEVMAWYEGARWLEPDNNVTGRQCPLCDSWGVKVRRYYRCSKCGLE